MATVTEKKVEAVSTLQREGEQLACADRVDEAIAIFRKVIAMSRSRALTLWQGRGYMWWAYCLIRKDRPKLALHKYELSLKAFRPVKDEAPGSWVYVSGALADLYYRNNLKRQTLKTIKNALPEIKGNAEGAKQNCDLVIRTCSRLAPERTNLGQQAADALREIFQSIKAEQYPGKPTPEWIQKRSEFAALFLDSIPQQGLICDRAWQLFAHEKLDNFRVSSPAWKMFCELHTIKSRQPTIVSMDMRKWKDPKPVVVCAEYPEGYAFESFRASHSGKYAAIALSKGGSDRSKVRIKNLRTGKYLRDEIDGLRHCRLSWRGDEGFYYVRTNELLFHKLGTNPKNDPVIFVSDKGTDYISPWLTRDYLLITAYDPTTSEARYFYRNEGRNAHRRMRTFKEAHPNVGPQAVLHGFFNRQYWFASYARSNFGRVVRYDPGTGKRNVILAESDGMLVDYSRLRGKRSLAWYRTGFRTALRLFNGSKLEREWKSPPLTVLEHQSWLDPDRCLVTLGSAIQPDHTYELDMRDLKLKQRVKVDVPFDTDQYEMHLRWYKSFDGTKIPMQIIHRKGASLKDLPVKIEVYGGFSKNVVPQKFDPYNAILLELGCAIVAIGVRGGCEMGKKWHTMTIPAKKVLSVKDTIWASKYLQRMGIPVSRIGIEGHSNGGLITASAIALAPDHFGCAVIGNPVIDVLKYTHRYYGEYGDPQKHKKLMMQFAPLCNMKKADYPSILLKLSEHDDRVRNSHGIKFLAKLEELNSGPNQSFVRVYGGMGHSNGTTGSSAGSDGVAFFAHHFKLNTAHLAKLVKRDTKYLERWQAD